MGRLSSISNVIAASAARDALNNKVGLIGIGEMGSRMLKNLISSEAQEVVVCDDRSEALRQAEDLGAEIASSPATLASTEGVRVVISMLPTSKAVRDAYLGSRGIAQASDGVKPSLLIDCSTTDPAVSREIAQAMANVGLHRESRPFHNCSSAHPAVVDAPVSGGITAAASGKLTFMVGGSPEGAKAAEPYLKMLGQHILYCGKHGNGQIAKVANNLALGIQMASIAESMSFGIKHGIDAKILAEIFSLSSSRCWSTTDYNPVPGIMDNVPASRDYRGGFACSHMVKDLRIALANSENRQSDLPMGQAALNLYQKVAESDPALDFGAIYRLCYQDGTPEN